MRWPFRGEVNEATFLGHASVTGLVAIPWHCQRGGGGGGGGGFCM